MKEPFDNQQRPEEKQKFNMDLAFQESLHKLLMSASGYGISGNVEMRFNILKQIKIMIASALGGNLEKHNKIQKALMEKINTRQQMMGKRNIWFESGGYLSTHKNQTTYKKWKKIPLEFTILISTINKDLDNWEQKIRIDMASKGFFLLKSKTGLDATGL